MRVLCAFGVHLQSNDLEREHVDFINELILRILTWLFYSKIHFLMEMVNTENKTYFDFSINDLIPK